MMNLCPISWQEHQHLVQEPHQCLTYEKFSYLLKEDFMRNSIDKTKMTRRTDQSLDLEQSFSNRFTISSKDKNMKPTNSIKLQKATKNKGIDDMKLTSHEKAVDKRIQDIITKSKRCCKIIKQKDKPRPLASQEECQMSIKMNYQIENKSQLTDEEQNLGLVKLLSSDQFLKEQFNSQLLKKISKKTQQRVKNQIIYDSLRDNRLCGMSLRQEGEIEFNPRKWSEILQRMYQVE